MRFGITISILLLGLSTASNGQNAPAAVGNSSATPASSVAPTSVFSFPSLDGTFHYALSASEIVQFGYFGSGVGTGTAALSANASYSTTSVKTPFSLLYSGGLLISESSQQNTTTYQNLAASQSLIDGNWIFGITDSVSYLPQSPTSGLSGIPGTGSVGALPVSGPSSGPSGGVLTYYGSRVSNSLSGSVERLITGRTSVSGVGSWTILHFLDASTGYDNSQVSGQVALNHRIDERDAVSANAVYSIITFGQNTGGLSLTTRGINGVYSRVISRELSANVSVGPQWTSSSYSALVPNRTDVAVSADLTYARQLTNASISYSRGVNGGSGVDLGAFHDTVSGSVSHSYGRDWLGVLHGSYIRTTSLGNPAATPPEGVFIPLEGNFWTAYGGVQVSHSFTRSVSMYGSYTVTHQVPDAAYTGTNAFSGTYQTIGIGISYAPRATRLGQF